MVRAKYRVHLNRSVTGQGIADAVKKITAPLYHQEMVLATDEGISYLIGRKSPDPACDLVIGVREDALPEINLNLTYNHVFVRSWSFGGEKYLVIASDEEIIKAIRIFRDLLEEALNPSTESPTTDLTKQDIHFTYEGAEYLVGSEAYHRNRILLPDGRLIAAKVWMESLPPQPQGLEQIGSANGVLARLMGS